jgi:hypothetical protein
MLQQGRTAMPPDRAYLTTSLAEAKNQINRRKRSKPSYDDGSSTAEWHKYNRDLLKRLFTTSELAEKYDATIKTETSRSAYRQSGSAAVNAIANFLTEILETLNLYTPPNTSSIPNRAYLTTSVDEAKNQINRRKRSKPSYDDGSSTAEWHKYNRDLLKRLFTTSELAEKYDATIKTETSRSAYRQSGSAAVNAIANFLTEILETLNLYTPPITNPTPSSRSPTPDVTPMAKPQIPASVAKSEAEREICRMSVIVEHQGHGECIVTSSRLVIRFGNDVEQYPLIGIRSIRGYGPTWSESIHASARWIAVTPATGDRINIKAQNSDADTGVLLSKLREAIVPF